MVTRIVSTLNFLKNTARFPQEIGFFRTYLLYSIAAAGIWHPGVSTMNAENVNMLELS